MSDLRHPPVFDNPSELQGNCNASDVRNKAAIQSTISMASSNHSITSFFGAGNKKPKSKRFAAGSISKADLIELAWRHK